MTLQKRVILYYKGFVGNKVNNFSYLQCVFIAFYRIIPSLLYRVFCVIFYVLEISYSKQNEVAMNFLTTTIMILLPALKIQIKM